VETHHIEHKIEIQDHAVCGKKALLIAFQDMEDNSECRPLLYNRCVKEVIWIKHPGLLASK
jgi:hypothetical protein